MQTLLRDIRFAFRLIVKRPLPSFAALACLALGIGATTVVFSLVDGVLLRPLPYHQPDRLFAVFTSFPDQGVTAGPVSGLELLDLEEQNRSFEQLVGYIPWYFNLTGVDDPERLVGARVSSQMFRMLGVSPARGRIFEAAEEQREEKVAVLSHALWQRRFGGDPGVVGQRISLEQEPYTVVGVMPESFRFLSETAEIWVPLEINLRVRRDQRGVSVVGRLASGITPQQAAGDLDAIASRLASEYAQFYPEGSGFGLTLQPLHETLVGDLRPVLLALLAAVGLVLLISCTNVANLLLAQATIREREITLRAAIGAGRGRLVRQLITESVVLALVGGAIGSVLAYLGTSLVVRFGVGALPRLSEVSVDARVLAFAFAVSLATGILFGLVPAIRATRGRLVDVLKEETRGSTGGAGSALRSALVVGQIALALVVLIGTGLLLRSFQSLQRTDPGFRTDQVLTAQFFLPLQRYFQRPQRIAFSDRLLTAVTSDPAVESAALVSHLPMAPADERGEIVVDGRTPEAGEASPQVGWRMVTAGYFETFGIGLVRGRTFNALDHAEAAPVVIVDRNLAERLWHGGDALGRRLQLVGAFGGDPERTVVGVVGAIKERSLEGDGELLYIPYAQRPTPTLALVLRSRGEPMLAAAAVKSAARVADPDLPVASLEPASALVASSLDQRRFNRLLFILFGGAALLLAGLGVYSVMAYAVAQRRRELGLRSALGAAPSSVLMLVLRQSLKLAVFGIVLGIVSALVLTRMFQSALGELAIGVSLTDAVTYLAVPTMLAALALVASFLPARSASRIDPIVALRVD